MNKFQQKHIINLSNRERTQLQRITHSGTHKARVITRAAILLKSHQGLKDRDISSQCGVSTRTVERTRTKYTEEGLKRALYDAPRSGQPPILDNRAEARLVALACSDAPKGRIRWTLELLQKRLLNDNIVKHISLNAIHEHLVNRGIKPWREKNVVRAEAHA